MITLPDGIHLYRLVILKVLPMISVNHFGCGWLLDSSVVAVVGVEGNGECERLFEILFQFSSDGQGGGDDAKKLE